MSVTHDLVNGTSVYSREVAQVRSFAIVHVRVASMSSSRVALVTGSNQGIGLEIVRQLSKKFDGVVLLAGKLRKTLAIGITKHTQRHKYFEMYTSLM